MKTSFTKSNEIAAAWIDVEPLLATKVRGDDLLREEIAKVAHGVAIRRLESRIRQYYLRKGIDLIPLVRVGWHLPTHGEQVRDRAQYHFMKKKREAKRELHAASTVDASALDAGEKRLQGMHLHHSSQAIAMCRDVEKERKLILGSPVAHPQLIAKKEKPKSVLMNPRRGGKGEEGKKIED